jgi:thiol-disulfide isomerase/thioredoxin
MNKKVKKSLIEYSIILGVFGFLYFTGLHTEVLGLIQRGVLKTGIADPDIKNDTILEETQQYPKANYSMKLIDSEGREFVMESLRGKVIFLNIWASWCPPCLAEMPGINNLYNQMDKNKVAFIMLSVDDDFAKALKLRKKKGYDFEIYQAPAGLPRLYYSQSIPTTYVINSKGELVFKHDGMGDFDTKEFKAYMEGLMNKSTD